MCGRCISFIYDDVQEIIAKIEARAPLNFAPDWPARVQQNFPRSVAPLILPTFDTSSETFKFGKGSLIARELSWGFEESWKPGVVFNTRIESSDKPMWRQSMVHRRCIIPVQSFFETNQNKTFPSPQTGKLIKRQYEFLVPGQQIILIGCIWRDGEFSMVTTSANADMAPIHHRMPLIVRPEELSIWLGPNYRSLADRSDIKLEAERAR